MTLHLGMAVLQFLGAAALARFRMDWRLLVAAPALLVLGGCASWQIDRFFGNVGCGLGYAADSEACHQLADAFGCADSTFIAADQYCEGHSCVGTTYVR